MELIRIYFDEAWILHFSVGKIVLVTVLLGLIALLVYNKTLKKTID